MPTIPDDQDASASSAGTLQATDFCILQEALDALAEARRRNLQLMTLQGLSNRDGTPYTEADFGIADIERLKRRFMH